MRPKRIRNNIYKSLDHYQRKLGQRISYYVWNTAVGEDSIFDEGGRSWLPPVLLPAVEVIRQEGAQEFRDEGSYTVENITVTINPKTWALANLPEPSDSARNNDRIGFEGKLYSVDSFQVQSRILNVAVVYQIQATQVQPDEQYMDAQ